MHISISFQFYTNGISTYKFTTSFVHLILYLKYFYNGTINLSHYFQGCILFHIDILSLILFSSGLNSYKFYFLLTQYLSPCNWPPPHIILPLISCSTR